MSSNLSNKLTFFSTRSPQAARETWFIETYKKHVGRRELSLYRNFAETTETSELWKSPRQKRHQQRQTIMINTIKNKTTEERRINVSHGKRRP